MDFYLTRVEFSPSGDYVIIVSIENSDLNVKFTGVDAKRVAASYGLEPGRYVLAKCEVDENGFLHLGLELEDKER